MPLYKYSCPVDGCLCEYDDVYFPLDRYQERIFDWCPRHGHGMFIQNLSKAPAVHDWGMGRYYEHVSATGETFYSKKSFKDYCKKHGLAESASYG